MNPAKFQNKILALFSAVLLSMAAPARAVCPVCVVAVASGFGLCRWLGIDDTISGLWIGGLLVAVSLWTIDWFEKKNWKFKFYQPVIFIAYYAMAIWPLLSFDIMGHPLNKLWGADKILIGLATGTAVFFASVFLNGYLKKRNGNKVYFPYQKVVIPFLGLAIFSLIFYLIIKCY